MKKLITLLLLMVSLTLSIKAQYSKLTNKYEMLINNTILPIKYTYVGGSIVLLQYESIGDNKEKNDTIFNLKWEIFKLKLANIVTDHKDSKQKNVVLDSILIDKAFGLQAKEYYEILLAYVKEQRNDNTAADWGMDNLTYAAFEEKNKAIASTKKEIITHKKDKSKLKEYKSQNDEKIKKIKLGYKDKIEAEKFDSLKKIIKRQEQSEISAENKKLKEQKLALNKSFRANKKKLRKELKAFNRDAKYIIKEHSKPFVYLSGSAFSFLNKSLNNDSVKSNVSSIGIHAIKANLYDFDADITFSQTEDVIKSADRNVFGSSILVPGIRKFSLLTNYRNYGVFKRAARPFFSKLGFNISFNATQVQWQYTGKDSSLVNNNNPVRVVPLAFDAGLTYDWIIVSKDRNNINEGVRVSTDIGICNRAILGNLGQSFLLLEKYLGSPKMFYTGLYMGLNVKIQRITIFFNGVYIPNYGISVNRIGLGRPVPGLTGGQLVSNLGFRADIIKF